MTLSGRGATIHWNAPARRPRSVSSHREPAFGPRRSCTRAATEPPRSTAHSLSARPSRRRRRGTSALPLERLRARSRRRGQRRIDGGRRRSSYFAASPRRFHHARPVHDAHVPDLDARDAPEQRRVRLGVAVAFAGDERDGREALRDERVEDSRRTLHSVRRSGRAWPVKYTATAGFVPSAGETPVPPPVTASRFGARDDDASLAIGRRAMGWRILSLPRETVTSTASAHARAQTRRARLRGLALGTTAKNCQSPGAPHRVACPRVSPRGGL